MLVLIVRIFLVACFSVLLGCERREPAAADSVEALVELVKGGDLESVRLTIDADRALANGTRADGVPLLYFASASGNREMVEYLLGMGAVVDARIDCGGALSAAVEGEFDSVVQVLLEAGASPDILDDWKQAPLHLTTRHRRDMVARMLIEAGADVGARDGEGRTPLHRCKSLAVAKLLVEKGADVNAVDDRGYTPLHWAATPREIVDGPTSFCWRVALI